MARPTKCTPEIIEEFARYLAQGSYFVSACALVGVDEATGYRWLERGRAELERVEKSSRRSVRKSEAIFVEFCKSVTRATSEAELKALLRIQKASAGEHEGDWRAAAWFLERRLPDRWRERKSQDVSGEVKVATGADVAAALGLQLGGEDE